MRIYIDIGSTTIKLFDTKTKKHFYRNRQYGNNILNDVLELFAGINIDPLSQKFLSALPQMVDC